VVAEIEVRAAIGMISFLLNGDGEGLSTSSDCVIRGCSLLHRFVVAFEMLDSADSVRGT